MRHLPGGRGGSRIRKIVSLKSGVRVTQYMEEIKRQGGEVIEHLPLINALLCEFPLHKGEVAGILESHPHVVRVEDDLPIKIIYTEPLFFFRRGTMPPQTKQQVGWGVKRIGGEVYLNVKPRKRLRAAIMDTGIMTKHPDLKGNVAGGINITGTGSDILDPNGHGTHVAGIIGALNNEIGIVGVMPEVDLYAVKVFDSRGDGSLSNIIRGLQWCINQGIKVVNMSFGSATDNDTFREVFKAAERAGIIMVAAAGNDQTKHQIQYPAVYTETVAVSSLNELNSLSNFSSYGPEIDLIAPGEQILSTWNNGSYKTLSGTSMAAPHVSGVILQVLNKWGNMSPAQIKRHLKNTAQRLPIKDEYQGAGLIDLAKALSINPRMTQSIRSIRRVVL
ncbi:MAG: S8 family peptidase [Syntrophomonadaceae bacterium]|nr:S8 family peptidase [Syntrophomonadaceae bacterium]